MNIKILGTRPALDLNHPIYILFVGSKNFDQTVLTDLKQLGASELLINQAKRKLSEHKDPKAKGQKLLLSMDSGSKIWFLSLGDLSTYDQHTELRHVLGHDFEKLIKGTVFVDTKRVPKNQQGAFIDAVVSLIHLSHWEAPKISKETKHSKELSVSFDFFCSLSNTEVNNIIRRAKVLAEATNLVRTLSDTPANRLTPSAYLEFIQVRSKKMKYNVEFYDRKKLQKLGAGAFLAVTQGNPDDDGGIVHLSYAPKKKKKKLILVGKGLCFDTGGYNIKTRSMYGMQKDMTGSAIALAVFESMQTLDLPYEVHAFLGIAENLVSHRAYKPSDVVIASDGTSIEVTDTDAEGRMVLADVLALARKEGGDLILDFATLTGSVMRALDTRRAGVYSNREKLLRTAYEVGEECGERVWGFPIGQDYREQLKSDVADILQCRIAPEADHIYAATFLAHFVGDEIPWIHMDLAPSEHTGGLGLVSTLSTGFGVRWALCAAEEILGG